MTSLHVICDGPLPMKNFGYAYATIAEIEISNLSLYSLYYAEACCEFCGAYLRIIFEIFSSHFGAVVTKIFNKYKKISP